MAVRRHQRRAAAFSEGQAINEMRTCVTCGAELHPERAKKYDYCMSPECQKKNLKGLTMVAVGVNKAAEQYLLLDEDTKAELASGKYHDQRRGSFGTSPASPGTRSAAGTRPATATGPAPSAGPATGIRPAPASDASRVAGGGPAVDTGSAAGATPAPVSGGAGRAAERSRSRPQGARPASRSGTATKARQPWTSKQARLALLYNEQGLRPEEIAAKLGLSGYAVTQIILTARNRGKL
jgi:hypothetical protein